MSLLERMQARRQAQDQLEQVETVETQESTLSTYPDTNRRGHSSNPTLDNVIRLSNKILESNQKQSAVMGIAKKLLPLMQEDLARMGEEKLQQALLFLSQALAQCIPADAHPTLETEDGDSARSDSVTEE